MCQEDYSIANKVLENPPGEGVRDIIEELARKNDEADTDVIALQEELWITREEFEK